MLNNKLYDSLKWVAQIVLPALGALYFGLSQIWGLPNGEEVVGTITLVDVFLGALLGLSAARYKDANEPNAGYLTQTGVDPETTMPNLGLTITKAPDELLENETVTFKVGEPPARPPA